MTDELVRVRGATFRYSKEPALIDTDLTIGAGDFTGIVGPSGSGKTTLLKVLAGVLVPQVGTVYRADDLTTGYVPQVDRIDWYFPVTALEVVLMAADQKNIWPWSSRDAKKRAKHVFDELSIGNLADRHIRTLSGGEQQRVFIARALMGHPRLLLLDEPISGVDVATRHDVLHLLHDLNHTEGIAVVLTTHDLNGIAAHTHTLVCLNRSVIAAGDSREILTPQVLERTYGAPLDVLSHGGMPIVVDHVALSTDESTLEVHHEHR
ncbi:MAG: metal ABC transporter ATP-binding protein [Actinomycetota bacterium]